MARLAEHPTVKWFHARAATGGEAALPQTLDAAWLRQVCLEAGANDVGFVESGRADIDGQQGDIVAVFPGAKTLVSIVCRMNRENIRTPARSIARLQVAQRSGFVQFEADAFHGHEFTPIPSQKF